MKTEMEPRPIRRGRVGTLIGLTTLVASMAVISPAPSSASTASSASTPIVVEAGTQIPGATFGFDMALGTDVVAVAVEAGVSDAQPDGVAILDGDGTYLSTLDVPGASGVEIVGTTLYVASRDTDAILRFDLTTDPPSPLGQSSIAPLDGPMDIVSVGDKVWFGSDCLSTSPGAVGSMELDGTGIVQVLPPASDPDYHNWQYCPRLQGNQNADETLFLYAQGLNPAHLEIWSIGVDPPTYTTDTPWTHGWFYGSPIAPLPGATTFAIGAIPWGTDGMDIRAIADYSLVAHYDAIEPVNEAIAHSDSSNLLAGFLSQGSRRVVVWNEGNPTPRTQFAMAGNVQDGGLAFDETGTVLYALVKNAQSGGLELSVLDPLAVPTTTVLNATPSSPFVGQSVTLTGTLAFDDGAPAGGESITVTRSKDAGASEPIGIATTQPDGTFQLIDTPPSFGSYSYTATFEGDGVHQPSNDGAAVHVRRRDPGLSITTSKRRVTYGASVQLTAQLGSGPGSRVVVIYAKPYGKPQVLLKEGAVGGDLKLSVLYTPKRNTTFIATFEGNAIYGEDEDTTSTKVRVITRGVLIDYFARSGAYRLYHAGTVAKARFSVIPGHSGQWIVVTLQAFVNGAWRSADSASLRLRDGSRVIARAAGRAGINLRMRATMPGHGDHLASSSAWLYFRFV